MTNFDELTPLQRQATELVATWNPETIRRLCERVAPLLADIPAEPRPKKKAS